MSYTGRGTFGGQTSTATSSAFTPGAAKTLVVFAGASQASGTPADVTISGSQSLNWEEVANLSRTRLRLKVFAAVSPAPAASMTISLSCAGAAAVSGAIVELPDTDFDFSNLSSDTTRDNPQTTLPNTPNNQVFGACVSRGYHLSWAPPSGYTEIYGFNTGLHFLGVAFESPGTGGLDTWDPSGSSASIAVIFEAITAKTLTASGFANASAFGAANLKRTIKPVGIAAANGFGAPHVKRSITPPSIASGIAFGSSPALTGAIPTLVGQGIANANGFGAPSLSREIEPSSIASALAFGTPSLIKDYVYPSSIASALAFGAPNVANTAKPPSIVNANAFGSPFVGLKVGPPGIASGVSFGGVNVFIGAYASPAAERRHKADEQPRIARRVPV